MAKMRGPYSERYDGLQIKIESKKLKSGKCQVKFYTKGLLAEDFYGYALVAEEKPLKEVVREIKEKVERIGSITNFYQQHLFSIKRNTKLDTDFVIFKT
ncbi:MAG: hypothetical protein MI975_02720 [Cytophagales bacterium]|nr:hypothetical protein [Cytophagales bacterium]